MNQNLLNRRKIDMNETELNKISVIVAEDEKFMSNILRVRFEEAGFDVRVANDGVEAWNLVQEQVPNVILLDLVMPNMDGFDFLSKLKNDPKYQSVRVVVTSNLGQDEDRKKVLEMGVDDYIVKAEIDIDRLVEKIKQLSS